MSSITIDSLDLIRSPEALTCEWLETNGAGGYASSSILQCHTRKYHGLLVANLTSPSGRYVLVSKVEDSISVGNRESYLVSHQYPGYFFAGGQSTLRRFESGTCPKFTYEIEGQSLEKEILMIRGMDSVILKYRRPKFDSSCVLRIKPFFAYRGIHSLSQENTYFRGDVT